MACIRVGGLHNEMREGWGLSECILTTSDWLRGVRAGRREKGKHQDGTGCRERIAERRERA